MEETKVCNKCGQCKSIDDFQLRKKGKSQRRGQCRACRNACSAEWRIANPADWKQYKANWREKNRKHIADYDATWHAKNPEYMKEYNRKYYWSEENVEAERTRARLWAKNNPDIAGAKGARYRASLAKAIPSWSNKSQIQEFYTSAQGLSMLLGEWYEVDHIVPLQSKIVCGLHCEANLQILPKSKNISKGNRHWPDMP